MKKFLLTLPAIIFPYSLVFIIYCVGFNKKLFEFLFGDIIFATLPFFIIIGLITIICNVVFIVLSFKRKWQAKEIAKYNMIVKLCQIPAYIIIFILALISLIVPFLFILALFFLLFDCCTIILSGTIGLTASIRAYQEKTLSMEKTILFAFMQFIFVLDVAFSIIMFCNLNKKSTTLLEQTKQ